MLSTNGANFVIKNSSNDRNQKARFLCCSASSWLVSVVLIESLIMVGWVLREYHVFDYTCIITRPNKSFGEMSGPRIIYAATDKQNRKRNLRVIEVNSNLTGHVPHVIDVSEDKNVPLLVGTEKQQDFVFSNPIFNENLEKFKKKREIEDEMPSSTMPTIKKRRKLKKRIRTTPKPEDAGLTTIESVVLIQQLPISDYSDSQVPNGIKTIRAKTTIIKHIPQNSSTFGKKLKRRKKLKPVHSDESSEILELKKAESSFAEIPNSMEEPIQFGTKIRRFKSKSGMVKKQGAGKRIKQKSEIPLGNQTLPTIATMATTPSTANSTNSTLMAEAIVKAISAGFKDDKKSEEKSETSSPTATTMNPTTPSEVISSEIKPIPVLTVENSQFEIVAPNKPPGFQSKPRQNKFQTSVAEFSALALCAGRVTLDIWCIAQLLAALPFLIGICFRSQCLLFVRLMLDALFLVILFVYAITVIAFSVILYVLVDEMTAEVVCEWLVFGLLLTAVLLVAIVLFGIVLRCCELIVNERPKIKNKRSKSLLYTEIGSEQLLEAADEI